MPNLTYNFIDKELRFLLFANPALTIGAVSVYMENIQSSPLYEKEKMQQRLTRMLENFKSKVADDVIMLSTACDMAKKHIKEWAEKIDPPTLKDILEMSKLTSLPLSQILSKEYINPAEIVDLVDDYVIGQHDYLDKLSLIFYSHYLRVYNQPSISSPRANLLVYGPTGVGKTYAVQVLAKAFNLNFGIINCNALVQEGIIGQNITSVFQEIYEKNGGEISAVENSIILFDEFDKLLEPGLYNQRIINEVLNIIDDDGKGMFMEGKQSTYKRVYFETKNIFFIFSGVFKGLRDAVNNKLNAHSLGFHRKNLIEDGSNDFYKYVMPEDFKAIGIKPEILGRIHAYTYVRELSQKEIVDILLNAAQSPFESFVSYFESHDVDLRLSKDGAEAISEYVIENKLGARGIKSFLWHILEQEMWKVPTDELGDKRLIVDKYFVQNKLVG